MKKLVWVLLAAAGYALLTNHKPKEVKVEEPIVLVDLDPKRYSNVYNFAMPAATMVQ